MRRTHVDHGRDEASGSMSALIDQITGLARRQYRVFIIVPAMALAIGLLYLLVTPSQYTATTTLLIDSTTLRVLQNQLQPQGDVPLDTLQVGSQVEILASRKLGLAVVRDLHLADDPEFAGTGNWNPFASSGATEDREQHALDEFLAHRSIARADKTYALNISYTSKSAATAAKIANAIAEAYIDDQLGAKYQTVTRAGAWLQDRINELKAKAAAADRAVLDFKEKNNIVDLGGAGTSAAGANTFSRLIGEQQLYELNSQLATARGATSEAKARLDRIEQVRKMDVSEGAVADTLKNEVITRLRNQYMDLSAREANISGRYGADHAAASNLRDQMEELRRNIRAELGRIAGSYRSDYEIARTREENLERSLATLVSEGQLTNRDKLGLAELESSAKVYHTLFDNFLQRYMEAIQQQSFPITDARIISPAVAPTKKSKPVTSLVLAIALSLGLMASVGIAALREAVDGVFRTARQAEQELGARCLSVIPLASASASPVPPRSGAAMVTDPSGLAALPPPQGALEPAATEEQRYAFSDSLKRRAVDDPISVFTEAFRAIKVSAWLQANVRENKVIGITSTLPSEGKSTVAANLAALMADAGRRVVLIDADLRNPTLARSLTPRPQAGWLEVMSGKLDLAQATGREPTTGLALLPLLLTEAPVHSDEVLASQGFRDLLERLRQSYDYIIVDLPPLAPVVDVRAIVPAIDSFVFVVEWGATSVKTVRRHLLAETELHDRLLGVVLNKANLRMLERFEQPGIYQNGYYMRGG
ncbi:polysaccharide biosynthesis tyrosine autokinase [Bradyrhizobium liaoningense]|uniref:polysaccharide biosynthesis tyrosine autokinase n=1 Tax=Bradyrhizobium liaoningense TaxID=43992 RepID=UPI001BA57745|nr:polysaccharide biosynthesis tyrosine autokinase [Bradyrhizobium liaoningense]MBR0838996.1 polysaccharide biosynthesis tyrosine autokinase [Bradyrhizobium liaoningense]